MTGHQESDYGDDADSTAEGSGDRESRPGGTGRIVVLHGPDSSTLGTVVDLGDDLLLLGREIDGHGLNIGDRHMSRVHARVVHDTRAGMFRVGDAGSRNGTFVNGKRIDTVLLSDGDVIRTGDTLMVYSEIDAMERLTWRADAMAVTDIHLLIRGETGTGKEVLARRIHRMSERRGELVAVNCAGLPPDLVAAEFFGHTKQAFSGAGQVRPGLFMAAQGGTLLLDEVGDCPLDVQAALLRAIQEKRIRPVGSDREVPVDVRIIAATNVDLERAVEQGRFRADLLARLSQSQLTLPPLRSRRLELFSLLREQLPEGFDTLHVSADAAEALLLWHWPMNVRELQALVRSHVALRREAKLDLPALAKQQPAMAELVYGRRRNAPSESPPSVPPPGGAPNERTKLRALLETHGGNVSAVADALGKPRAQVYRWMRSMGLSAEKFRRS